MNDCNTHLKAVYIIHFSLFMNQCFLASVPAGPHRKLTLLLQSIDPLVGPSPSTPLHVLLSPNQLSARLHTALAAASWWLPFNKHEKPY